MTVRRKNQYKQNPLARISLILSVAVPVITAIFALSFVVFKVDSTAQVTDKIYNKVYSIDTRMTIVETTLQITEPAKRQGVSK